MRLPDVVFSWGWRAELTLLRMRKRGVSDLIFEYYGSRSDAEV